MLMSKPIDDSLDLKINLDVDAKVVDNWYQAKWYFIYIDGKLVIEIWSRMLAEYRE